VVAYSGDDERFEYVYKFVSKGVYDPADGRAARAHNMTLLDEGYLYVARFTGDSPPEEFDGSGTLPSDGQFDGTGRWIPLVKDGRSMIPGQSVAWVLTFTRLAADRLGKQLDADGDLPDPAKPVVTASALVPTRMDRPEDIQTNPVTGRVYAAMTNNTRRTGGPDEANPLTRFWAYGLDEAGLGSYAPRPGNRNGHVIEWIETDGVAGRDFYWRIFLIAGDPDKREHFAGYDKSRVSPISCPDNLEFDSAGNLWISTDGNALSIVNEREGTVGGSNDGLFAVPTAGPERGHLKQFLTVPVGAECSGPQITRTAGPSSSRRSTRARPTAPRWRRRRAPGPTAAGSGPSRARASPSCTAATARWSGPDPGYCGEGAACAWSGVSSSPSSGWSPTASRSSRTDCSMLLLAVAVSPLGAIGRSMVPGLPRRTRSTPGAAVTCCRQD
jgi:secreted PhoX family phosphatase